MIDLEALMTMLPALVQLIDDRDRAGARRCPEAGSGIRDGMPDRPIDALHG